MSSYEHLVVERHGPVGWLINDRPDQLNAMNGRMRDEFADAWLELDKDPEVRVIVHTGNGRAFQTGVDVSELATDGVGMERYRASVESFDLHFTAWHQQVWKPVITAVNGICAGGGFHWVADADIVIAASDAEFFDPHTSIGQVVSLEAIALDPQDARRGGHADGVRRQVRAHAGRARPAARTDPPSGRRDRTDNGRTRRVRAGGAPPGGRRVACSVAGSTRGAPSWSADTSWDRRDRGADARPASACQCFLNEIFRLDPDRPDHRRERARVPGRHPRRSPRRRCSPASMFPLLLHTPWARAR